MNILLSSSLQLWFVTSSWGRNFYIICWQALTGQSIAIAYRQPIFDRLLFMPAFC